VVVLIAVVVYFIVKKTKNSGNVVPGPSQTVSEEPTKATNTTPGQLPK
jgi:hypothetical protein